MQCKVASSVFTAAVKREGVTKLVAKDTHLWDMDDYEEDPEEDEDDYEGCSEEDEGEYEEEDNDDERVEPNVTVYPETQGNKDEKAARMAYSGAYLSIEVTAGPSLPPFVVPDTLPEPEKKSSEESEESEEGIEGEEPEEMNGSSAIQRLKQDLFADDEEEIDQSEFDLCIASFAYQ